MAEQDNQNPERGVERRRGPDLLTLLCGIGALLVSTYVLTDGEVWLPRLDPRWLLAGGALVVGLFLLAASVRGTRRRC